MYFKRLNLRGTRHRKVEGPNWAGWMQVRICFNIQREEM